MDDKNLAIDAKKEYLSKIYFKKTGYVIKDNLKVE